MEVCIVGCGFSGIASAKVCKDHGLTPVVLCKDSSTGGLWRSSPNQIGVWPSIRTTGSKYFMSFSDYPFKAEVEDIPKKFEVLSYMEEYIEKHELLKYFLFNSNVTKISRQGEDYLVTWVQESQTKQKVFKFVMVCIGYESKEYFPFENVHQFNGTVLKSGFYRDPSIFNNKNVLVIGRGFSGTEITLESVLTAAKVTQVLRTPRFVLINDSNRPCWDLFVFSIKSFKLRHSLFPDPEEIAAINSAKLNFFGNPEEIIPDWKITEENFKYPLSRVHVSTDYIEAIKQKKIELVYGSVKGFYSNGVIMEDKSLLEADLIVSAVGFAPDFEFL
jgi:cation diffusion facilitator CzcD-associated flavoprotein CzcO